MDKQTLIRKLALISCLFTLIVIFMGAYTRLVDAGLGCPDWPGCYGHISVPSKSSIVREIDANYPKTPLVAHKAWAEMIHRYCAGTLGLLMVVIAGLGISCAIKQRKKSAILLYVFMLCLLAYQVTLGMLTVTWKLLPIIVSQHLLGGMLIISTLWLVYLLHHPANTPIHRKQLSANFRPWALLLLILLFCQIALGAWTSTNYASLVCPDFPFCHAHHPFAHWHLHAAYNFHDPIGIDYQGGVLNKAVRATIQMVHRLGAFIVTLYILCLAAWVNLKARRDSILRQAMLITICLLVIQVCLGISNVIFKLPLFVAVAHSVCAALLLLSVIKLNFVLYQRQVDMKYRGFVAE